MAIAGFEKVDGAGETPTRQPPGRRRYVDYMGDTDIRRGLCIYRFGRMTYNVAQGVGMTLRRAGRETGSVAPISRLQLALAYPRVSLSRRPSTARANLFGD